MSYFAQVMTRLLSWRETSIALDAMPRFHMEGCRVAADPARFKVFSIVYSRSSAKLFGYAA